MLFIGYADRLLVPPYMTSSCLHQAVEQPATPIVWKSSRPFPESPVRPVIRRRPARMGPDLRPHPRRTRAWAIACLPQATARNAC